MNSFYYPISSQDFSFENIFSSESVSPPVFYRKRGFGISYWHVLTEYQLEDVIVLYDQIPLPDTGNSDALIYVLQVFESALDAASITQVGEGVFLYPKTIYLSKSNFRILFFSDRDRTLTLLRSEASLPTKDIVKYKGNFGLIPEGGGKKFDITGARAKLQSDFDDSEIQFDRKFNFFKGLVYGVTVGLLANSVPRELMLKKRLRDLSNRFSELNNRVETAKHDSTRSKDYNGISLLINELSNLFEKTRSSFQMVFPKPEVTADDLEAFLRKKFPSDFGSLSVKAYLAFKELDDKLFKRDEYQRIVSQYLKEQTDVAPINVLQEMERHLDDYLANVQNYQRGALRRRDANNAFKGALNSLETLLDKEIAIRSENSGFNLGSIQYDIENNLVRLSENFANGNIDLNQLSQLLNIVLRNSRQKSSPIGREAFMNIVDEAKKELNDQQALIDLYKYLTNETKFFSIDKIESTTIKNFIAFVFNPDSIEKLSSFTQSKNIEGQWISYALWCAYNGFANISRNFLRPVFDREHFELQDTLDNYFLNYFDKHNKQNSATDLTAQQKFMLRQRSTNQSNDDSQLQLFYELHALNKRGISFAHFKDLTGATDRSKFIDILKSNYKVNKRDAIKIFDSLFTMLQSRQLF